MLRVRRFDCLLRADELNLRDDNGRTPLHCAVENDREAIVEMLCQNRLIDTTLRDDHKRTPLHLAVITGQKNLVEVCRHLTVCRSSIK